MYLVNDFLFQYPFEALFRSLQYALVDNACREYLFVSEYFLVKGQPALDFFYKILEKTLMLLQVSSQLNKFCLVESFIIQV